MKKFFCVMILFAALLVGGCESENFSVTEINGDISVEGENCTDSHGEVRFELDGGVLLGDAKIESGRIEIQVGSKTHTFDKSGEISFDVPAGSHEIVFTGADNFTGELTLKAVPKV